ncbi:chloride channel protein [Kitasatospora sp. NBC_01302]|uniref:chloride channel protein n=1 Tax=Kitasatospora sp. NBC_01302 TaxID=2903575 RepID=UPI002E143667|nr:chloride channel protein [Kitasatospora sp. NBC_01302]
MAQARPSAETEQLQALLRGRDFRRLLLVSALVGVPVSLVAFGFVSLEHWLQHGVWQWLPQQLGWSGPPWWWPLPALLLAGILVALVVTFLPGNGGHVPAHGLGMTATTPAALPGIFLAAIAGLPLGAVLGPEAPLMALGSGLALLGVERVRPDLPPQARNVLGASGAAAAISVIFGNPLVAGVLLIEAAGVGGPQLSLLLLPCLLASGVGALVFTGFDHWSGFGIGALNLPTVPPDHTPSAGDFLWGVPLAVLIACCMVPSVRLSGRLAGLVERRTVLLTVACATAVGGCAAVYALATGRSSQEAVLSGQATLAQLAATPHAWSVAALLALVVLKGVGWILSMGSLRGGPIFPSLFLGSALATLLVGVPGFGPAPALAVGLAAGSAAVLRLPLTAVVLATLLLGKDAPDELPLVIVSAVVSFVTGELLRAAPSARALLARRSSHR